MLIETWVVAIIFILVAASLCLCSHGWRHEEKNSVHLSKKIRELMAINDFQEKQIQKLQSEISILKLNLEAKKK